MSNKYKFLFSIIKASLTSEIETIEDSAIDYDELFNLSKSHQIIPLVCDGLYKLKINFEKKELFTNCTMSLLCRDQNQLFWLRKIEDAFSLEKIDYMLLKGASIKRIYPSSELRLMGDIDILIKETQYAKIKTILSEIGFSERRETDHELIWTNKSGVLIELHKRLIPSYNDDYYSYYSKPWEKTIQEKNSRYHMLPEDEYIYLFTHLTKHFRDGGIGLRHIIDIWIFRLKFPNLDIDYLNKELDKLKLKEFHSNILQTISVWFDDKEETSISEYITKRIIESGAYGIKEKWDKANAARVSSRESSVSKAKLKSILNLVFMPYSSMKIKYPFLTTKPFLLPFMWIVRWFVAIVHKRNNIRQQADRLNKINDNVVNEYNSELEMVGLKFDLKQNR